MEISADVTDFTLETTLTVVSNSLLNEVDTDDLASGDLGSLSDSLGKLTDAMDQLMDGSSQLYDGLCTLLDSCGQLSDGVDQLTDGLNQLSSNSSALNAGAKQVFTSLLAMADEQLQPQLAQAGITIPSLTIDNYATVLGGVLAQLDKAGTLAEQAAREQVTAAVEAAREQIRAAVTEAVQQQVTAQVTEQVRQQVLGQVLNAMGYTMEQYQQSPELKAQVDAAVELQVQTPAMQQTISENVTALMGTEEIQQKIDAATEQQVQLKIEETMASDEVQQKIMAATEQASAGAVQIRSLKQQLDQYNVFYMGLNSYTAGVDQAAAGAQRLQSNMPALLDGVKVLHMSGITPVLSESCLAMTKAAFALAKEKGVAISFDPNIRRKLWRGQDYAPLIRELTLQSEIVLLGLDEADALFGLRDPDAIFDLLFRDGCAQYVAIKDGGNGAWVADKTTREKLPPYPCKPIEPIGAGDGFNAGFLAGILQGRDVVTAGRMGAICGALATQTPGDVEGYPDAAQMEAALTGAAITYR